MKLLGTLLLVLIFCVCGLSSVFASEEPPSLTIKIVDAADLPQLRHSMTLMADGRVLLDNQPIELLSPPEIQSILAEIHAFMQKQSATNLLLAELRQQANQLREELAQCRLLLELTN